MTQQEFEERLYLVRRDGELKGWALWYILNVYGSVYWSPLQLFEEGSRI